MSSKGSPSSLAALQESATQVVHPYADSKTVFQRDLFVGKVLFCTGGGSGICKGMVEAVMAHGANAFIVGRSLERVATSAADLTSKTGKPCGYASADVRKPADLHAAVKACVEKFGRIDFVICGAAGNFLAPISGLSERAFETVMSIDTLGTYNTVLATLPYVRAAHGSYIHVSATLHHRGTPYQAHVSAAKAGVEALSAVIAVEEGPRGIRSNVIAPGPVSETTGFQKLSAKAGDKKAAGEEEEKNFIDPRTVPAGRFGRVGDIANMTVFLFSDAAGWVTGQVHVVDGGEKHTTMGMMGSYPDSVLRPKDFENLIKARM